jgi:hypothetical protein
MYVGNVEGKYDKEQLVQSKRLRGIEWWTRKYILVQNFGEELIVMLPLGVPEKMSKLMLKEILGVCTCGCVPRICVLSHDVN